MPQAPFITVDMVSSSKATMDSSISYGFATETIIANNLIRAVGGGVTKSARNYELRCLSWSNRKQCDHYWQYD
ncbi:hypothetical protein ACEQPO_02755 [Bacillus sp. SL00103]